ncbi:MAG: putative lipid II flippase FtsW [Deferribacteraceae bacterium]|jgi:cell division protein FtsW|nr:putative lipid II flippase FtsW [Deferribacteraceae bacterium]
MFDLRSNRFQLLFLTSALILIGMMFVYSTGSLQAIRLHKSDMYFLIKQMVSCGFGALLLIIAYKMPLEFYRKHIALIYFITLALLVAVFFQKSVNGAQRWIILPVFSFQPSELAKFTVVVYLAHYMDKKNNRLSDFISGFLPATLMIGGLTALILLEPDFGTTFLIVLVAFTIFVAGGVRALHIAGVVGFVIPIFMTSLLFGYRKGRLLVFLDPWADRFGNGYQLVQSLAAIGNGGFFGQGIGNSIQKLFFLPEAHTDFVYAIIAEEWGLIGALFVLILIIAFFKVAVSSALKHTDRYKKLLLMGITCFMFYQSVINILVVLGLLPTKGITLPFISYGGSAMMMSLFFVGVLLRGMEEAQ